MLQISQPLPILLHAVNLESPNRLLQFTALAIAATPQAKTTHLLDVKLESGMLQFSSCLFE